jgi:hypothetical protein
MSWRMVQYFIAEWREQQQQSRPDYCCPSTTPGGGFRPPLDDFILPDLGKPITPQFYGTHFDQHLELLTGKRPPNEYRVKPEVLDLGIEQAKVELGGNGIEIAEMIDIDDLGAVEKIRDATIGIKGSDLVLDDGAVSPGDKVALIIKDGVAIDYVKVETGAGKFLFEQSTRGNIGTDSDVISGGAHALTELEATLTTSTQAAREANADLEAQINAHREATTGLNVEFESLRGGRDELDRELGNLTRAVDTARAELAQLNDTQVRLRTETSNEISNAEREIGRLRTQHTELSAELDTVRTQVTEARSELNRLTEEQSNLLAEARRERDSMITSIRRETPVSAVVADENLVTVLARQGITNLAGLAALPDEQLQEVAAQARVNLNTARRFKREAVTHIAGTGG